MANSKVSARQRAQAAKQALDVQRRDYEKKVEAATVDYYEADDARAAALEALGAADVRRANAVRALFGLGEPADRVAALVGLPAREVTKLRRLQADATDVDDAAPSPNGSGQENAAN